MHQQKTPGTTALSDLQKELISICSGLVGEEESKEDLDLENMEGWDEQRGGEYCMQATKSFLEKAAATDIR